MWLAPDDYDSLASASVAAGSYPVLDMHIESSGINCHAEIIRFLDRPSVELRTISAEEYIEELDSGVTLL